MSLPPSQLEKFIAAAWGNAACARREHIPWKRSADCSRVKSRFSTAGESRRAFRAQAECSTMRTPRRRLVALRVQQIVARPGENLHAVVLHIAARSWLIAKLRVTTLSFEAAVGLRPISAF